VAAQSHAYLFRIILLTFADAGFVLRFDASELQCLAVKLAQTSAAVFYVVLWSAAVPGARAQQSSQADAHPYVTAASNVENTADTPHRFWDAENALLFSGVGAARFLDYSSTLNLRRRGRDEILLTNWAVDNHPLFAGIEAAGTAVSITASYLLHRTGHHRLERWFSALHIGVATGGAIRNYGLKTAHPTPP